MTGDQTPPPSNRGKFIATALASAFVGFCSCFLLLDPAGKQAQHEAERKAWAADSWRAINDIAISSRSEGYSEGHADAKALWQRQFLQTYNQSLSDISTAADLPALRTAENGSYYGQRNSNGVPKTVHVDGYYRSDGTYVRGHYRSRPNSNP